MFVHLSAPKPRLARTCTLYPSLYEVNYFAREPATGNETFDGDNRTINLTSFTVVTWQPILGFLFL